MKYDRLFLCIVGLTLYSCVYAKKEFNLLYTIHTDRPNYYIDTIYLERSSTRELTFFKNTVFLNREAICHFDSVEYYHQLVYMEYEQKRYLYIYPHYFERSGPYEWYGLGVLITLTRDGNITIDEGRDYCDNSELYSLDFLKQPRCFVVSDDEESCFQAKLNQEFLQQPPSDYFNSQIPLGIGLVNPLPSNDSLHIYADSLGQVGFVLATFEQQFIIPLYHKSGYNIFWLSATKDCGMYYEVWANPQTKVYIPKSEVIFETLDQFLMNALGINAGKAFTDKENPSSVVASEEGMIVLSVSGDWVEGVIVPLDEDDTISDSVLYDPALPHYYVRWREGDRMLVPVSLWW